jgi:hypothetical protein
MRDEFAARLLASQIPLGANRHAAERLHVRNVCGRRNQLLDSVTTAIDDDQLALGIILLSLPSRPFIGCALS